MQLKTVFSFCKKIVNLRVFDDENGVMNKSILDVQGEILVVSQFTLMASTKKGNRPSYIRAAGHEIAVPLYEYFCNELSIALGKEVGTGEFGADMKVELLNNGPVTAHTTIVPSASAKHAGRPVKVEAFLARRVKADAVVMTSSVRNQNRVQSTFSRSPCIFRTAPCFSLPAD